MKGLLKPIWGIDIMLKVNNVEVRYGEVPAIRDVSFEIKEGQVVSIVGSNGAGKTTLIKSISGINPIHRGEIWFDGVRIDQLPAHERVKMGISHIPEGRLVFDKLSVYDNLLLGAFVRTDEKEIKKTLEMVYELFPILKERSNQKAGTMSGGQQQMLAIARGLMSKPRLVMFDEPSLGLSPVLVSEVFDTIKRIKQEGLTIILVEQDVQDALELADYGYVLQNGTITIDGTGKELLNSDIVKKAYLGL